MNIADMHINFRLYAQQMGMQNTRGILPEQIDAVINTTIIDEVNQLIRKNISVTNDRSVTDNSKIGQINALRTLYNVKEKDIAINDSDFIYDSSKRLSGLIKHEGTETAGAEDSIFDEAMYVVDLSINYINSLNNDITNWYPIRIIDDTLLTDTLNDAILRNTWKSPIAVIYKNFTLELYIDKFKKGDNPIIEVLGGKFELTPNKLRVSTIHYPAKVKYVKPSQGQSVNCDLPEFMHEDIVKKAVNLYLNSINNNPQANQNAEQSQQYDNATNNYSNNI